MRALTIAICLLAKVRSAGDAVQLLGFEEPRLKATVSKVVMDYEHEVQNGRKLNPTVIQVEKFVEANDEVIGEAVRMAKQISAKCAEPCLTLKQCPARGAK